MITDPDVSSALSFYALQPDMVRQIEPVRGGWSGSQLWRIADRRERRLCLRCWPPVHPTPERLAFIHDILRRVADRLAIVPAPLPAGGGRTFIQYAGRLWELTPWLPGEADLTGAISDEKLRAAMQALARFHLAAADCQPTSGAAPAWLDRQQ